MSFLHRREMVLARAALPRSTRRERPLEIERASVRAEQATDAPAPKAAAPKAKAKATRRGRGK
jgi:hypothetical protein